jgi:hypothetical protein
MQGYFIPRVATIPDKGKCLRKGQAQINYPKAYSTSYGCSCAEGIFLQLMGAVGNNGVCSQSYLKLRLLKVR